MLKIILILLLPLLVTSISGSLVAKPLMWTGSLSEPGQFPFMAHITSKHESGTFYTTAVLITDRHLLTEAPTLFEFNADEYNVTLGVSRFTNQSEPGQQVFRITPVDIVYNDRTPTWTTVAIIQLREPVTFTDLVKPILLPRFSDKGLNYYWWSVTLVSWYGFVEQRQPAHINVTVDPNEACKFIYDKLICVDQDLMSFGDFGSALVHNSAEGPVLIGIFTYVARGKIPQANVFQRVNENLEWIEYKTGVQIRP